LHEYAEQAADWILRYKFTVIAAAAVVVGALVLLGARRHQAKGGETEAWERLAPGGSQNQAELQLSLPQLEGTTVYPWASLRVAASLYRRGRFADARAVVEPVAGDLEVDAYARGYCLYLLGCTYAEEAQTAQAKKSLEKALTVNDKSPFLQALVTRQLQALDGWPPTDTASEKAETEPAGVTPGRDPDTSDEGSDGKP